MRQKAFVAIAALAVLFYSVSAFAAVGTCQDWKGVWDFTYDNGTTPKAFCFDNTSVIDNGTIVACDNDLIENCTCIENISTTANLLCIDTETFAQCDNDLIINCTCVVNPVYKKLSVAKGTYEVKITDVMEGVAAQVGPISNTCLATGKRGTQAITIMAPDNATLNNASYKKYYPNVAKGSYVVQEGSGQALSNIHQCPQTRILKANFLSDNFTAENPYWNIPGLTKGEWVRDLTCEDLNNCSTTTTTTVPTTTTSIILSTTTTTTSGKKCPISQTLGDDDPNLANLRNFRDSKLAQSAIGRKIISIYYKNADSINNALERSPALKAFTRRMLEVIAPMVGRKEE
jgi:hypothetical protein